MTSISRIITSPSTDIGNSRCNASMRLSRFRRTPVSLSAMPAFSSASEMMADALIMPVSRQYRLCGLMIEFDLSMQAIDDRTFLHRHREVGARRFAGSARADPLDGRFRQ